jgi:hypothetical protein
MHGSLILCDLFSFWSLEFFPKSFPRNGCCEPLRDHEITTAPRWADGIGCDETRTRASAVTELLGTAKYLNIRGSRPNLGLAFGLESSKELVGATRAGDHVTVRPRKGSLHSRPGF